MPPAAAANKKQSAPSLLETCRPLGIAALLGVSLLAFSCKKKNPEMDAAERMVRMNPELEVVSKDNSKGEMTIRNKKDGTEVTMNLKDVAAGKVTVKDGKGNVTEVGQGNLSKVPAWVPRVPKVKSTIISTQNQEGDKKTGAYVVTTGESSDALDQFFKAQAEKLKLPEKSNMGGNSDGVDNRMRVYQAGGRTLTVTITGESGKDVQVSVTYEEAKEE